MASVGPTGESELRQLLAAARAGERAAFDGLCAPLEQRWLVTIACAIPRELRPKFDPQDILQEALAQVWRDLGDLKADGVAGFNAWVRGIARHRLADHLRYYDKDKRSPAREEAFHDSPESSAYRAVNTPTKSAARRELVVKLADALDELKESYRKVVIGRILEGCSAKEVAQATGMTPDNVNTTLHRALIKLRGILEARGIRASSLWSR